MIDFTPTRAMLRDKLVELLKHCQGTDSNGKLLRSAQQMMASCGYADVFLKISHYVDVLDPVAFCEELSWYPSAMDMLSHSINKTLKFHDFMPT